MPSSGSLYSTWLGPGSSAVWPVFPGGARAGAAGWISVTGGTQPRRDPPHTRCHQVDILWDGSAAPLRTDQVLWVSPLGCPALVPTPAAARARAPGRPSRSVKAASRRQRDTLPWRPGVLPDPGRRAAGTCVSWGVAAWRLPLNEKPLPACHHPSLASAFPVYTTGRSLSRSTPALWPPEGAHRSQAPRGWAGLGPVLRGS